MIKVIFFDTSDTLYSSKDFEKTQSNQPIIQLSELRGLSFEEAEILFKEKKAELKEKLDHVTKVAVIMELGVSRLQMQEYMARINAYDFLKPDEGLLELLKNLSGEYKLGIISNILEKAVLNVLDALNIPRDLFTHFVTVNNTDHSKPHPEPFERAIELAGCDSSEIIYIGDSLTKDMIPAKKAGLKTVWITSEEVRDEHVDHRVRSLLELEEVLKMKFR